ncbi:minor M protein 2 [Morelia viridis nidovirus]|uniref:Minor M protein 2 n=1 Tax=Morelia viridis nidovirus TaxID=2016400 RepID=A0A6B9D0C7_9NIDO|nr:minor M protein 2 [Morelia viridis nidovirus]QGW58074.1 minor M protein 2 [Morelia viridis nidovirus]QGW58081.1 minor M protein 2 [Morelia viridis nidovirus]
MYIFMIFIVSLVSSCYCGFNGTNIEPRRQNPINHPFMIWNDRNFICMTCFNESGQIYYYHPYFNVSWSRMFGYFVVDYFNNLDFLLNFEHSNKTFKFFNLNRNGSFLSWNSSKYVVNQSLYFDNISPFFLNVSVDINSTISPTNVFFQFNTSLGVGTNIRDQTFYWLLSPINSSIALGPWYGFVRYFRLVTLANITAKLSPTVALRFKPPHNLGQPRYFPSQAPLLCPTIGPVVTRSCPTSKLCQPQVKTVTVIKTEVKEVTKAEEQVVSTSSVELSSCKEQLNSFIIALVIVLCLLLAVSSFLMFRCSKQMQKQNKSNVY